MVAPGRIGLPWADDGSAGVGPIADGFWPLRQP
jgi:hypothetical protein